MEVHFMCLDCNTNIASIANCVDDSAVGGWICFQNGNNMVTDIGEDDIWHDMINLARASNVYCKNCNKVLGYRIVRAEGQPHRMIAPDNLILKYHNLLYSAIGPQGIESHTFPENNAPVDAGVLPWPPQENQDIQDQLSASDSNSVNQQEADLPQQPQQPDANVDDEQP